jgi:nicotinamide-nucleotide amidase
MPVPRSISDGPSRAEPPPHSPAEQPRLTRARRGSRRAAPDLAELRAAVGLRDDAVEAQAVSPRAAEAVAWALRETSGASHALSVLIQMDAGEDRRELAGVVCIGLATTGGATRSRQARLLGGREWIRLGAAEMALDCLRRHLLDLPFDEPVDFERR